MSEARRELLTVGAFFIILVVAIVLFVAGVIGWTLIVPVGMVLFGIWMIALSAMRGTGIGKYERSAFSTLSIGLLLIAVGGAWYLAVAVNWLLAVALVLLVFGALAITAALKKK